MKKILAWMLSVTLLFLFACPVSASSELVPFSTMVVDSADLLTDEQEDELAARAWAMTLDYDCAVYIVIMEGLDGMEPWRFNEQLYRTYDMGYGEDQSGIVLMLSMEYRDYDIMAHGYGNYAFTDYGKDVMADRFLDEFGDDDWYEGFDEYLDCCEEFLQLAANGTPYDVGSMGKDPVLGIVIGVGLPCLIAFIVCTVFRAQMKTAKRQIYAAQYVSGGGLHLTKRNDIYTHTTRRQRVIQTKSSGGTSVNRGGFSHKSGKF